VARFALNLQLSYSRTQDANAVRSALRDVLATFPTMTGEVGGNGSDVTFTGEAPDRPTVEAFQVEAVTAWGRGTREAGHSTITRVGEA
jgi:hypothetical protein